MDLDNSSYDLFMRNPEKYRITYEQNLVPRQTPYALARGLALHKKAEDHFKAYMGPTPEQMAEELWNALKAKMEDHGKFEPVGGVEGEFRVQIPGSPHHLVGRLDMIVREVATGDLWIQDYKTANDKSSETSKKNEFENATQPLFHINGAKLSGVDVSGMLYWVITEHRPPRAWPIRIRKTDAELRRGQLQAHQVAETILFYRRTFGKDMPWPHSSLIWPCSDPQKCEYSRLCKRSASSWSAEDLREFQPRVEHLSVKRNDD